MTEGKAALLAAALLAVAAALFAEAPELRFVMPNSWRLITRLPPEEEEAFLRDNWELRWETVRLAENSRIYPFPSNQEYGSWLSGETRVYRERVGEDTFYRMIAANKNRPDFSDQWETVFVQTLVYERRGRMIIVGVAPYNGREFHFSSVSSRYENYTVCRSLDIVRAGERARGILGTRLAYRRYDDGGYAEMVKGQVQGFHNQANYVLVEDLDRALDRDAVASYAFDGGIIQYEGMPEFRIEGSPCLVDPAVPLRYGLQNAFDGDPATSFVENTEDDLMDISLSGKFFLSVSIRRVAIINGYAQNMTLYRNNNRVGTMRVFNTRGELVEMPLADNTLSWQVVEEVGHSFSAAGIYRGERYNDTCLAEYNIHTDQYGWLFGDVDE